MTKKEKKENKTQEKIEKEERKEEIKEVKEEIEKVEKELEKEIEEESQKIISNLWFIGIIFLVIGLIVGLLIGLNLTDEKVSKKNYDKEEVTKVVENTIKDFYYNIMLSQGVSLDVEVNAKEVKDIGNLYNVTLELSINGQTQEIPVYITKDLKYVIPSIIKAKKDLNENELKEKIKNINEVQTKTERPKVVLAVMANCPYGNNAEALFKEIINTFGDKIEFEPRYIIYRGKNPYGSDVEANGKVYWSLKGNYELELGLFELSVFKLYGAKTWIDLVNRLNNECLTKYSGDQKIEELLSCAKEIAKELGVDVEKVDNYLKENKEKLLEEQAKLTNDLGILGSPTIIVNDQQYKGVRTVNAIKDFICTAFKNPPEECGKKIQEVKAQSTNPAQCGVN